MEEILKEETEMRKQTERRQCHCDRMVMGMGQNGRQGRKMTNRPVPGDSGLRHSHEFFGDLFFYFQKLEEFTP